MQSKIIAHPSPEFYDPAAFVCQLGLLISEARKPDLSSVVRCVEGSHHPTSLMLNGLFQPKPMYTTELNDLQTPSAVKLVHELKVLWTQNIPVSLIVQVLPDECQSKEPRYERCGLILERWSIQAVFGENDADRLPNGSLLLQAVRSFLHFSQLSAWFSASGGKSPSNIAYRLLPPDAQHRKLFEVNGNRHDFPRVRLNKATVLQVSVECPPRQDHMLNLRCHCGDKYTDTCSDGSTFCPQSDTDADSSVSYSDYKDEKDVFIQDAYLPLQTDPIKICDPLANATSCIVSPCSSTLSSNSWDDRLDVNSESFGSASSLTNYSPFAENFISSFEESQVTLEPISLPCHTEVSEGLSSATAESTPATISLKERLEAMHDELSRLSGRLQAYRSSSTLSGHRSSASSSETIPAAAGKQIRETHCRFFVSDSDNDEEDDEHISKIPPLLTKNLRKNGAAAKILFSAADNDESGSRSSVINHCSGTESSSSLDSLMDLPSQAAGDSACVLGSHSMSLVCSESHTQAFQIPFLKRPQSSSFACSSTHADIHGFQIKNVPYHYSHEGRSFDSENGGSSTLCRSAPSSTHLLGNFEESALNGRLKPHGSLDGFTVELGASGAFCPPHVRLPLLTYFFHLSDDNAPSPYLGHCCLKSLGRKGYHVPNKGTVQVTLFNPQQTVVKMFVVRFDLSEMPPSSQTFIRQRTFFMPTTSDLKMALLNRNWLRYLIHLRFASSRSGKLYLHTDIRMLFSRKSDVEADSHAHGSSNDYELRSFTEMPRDPKYSPRKISTRSGRFSR